jgi:hypothetical protein
MNITRFFLSLFTLASLQGCALMSGLGPQAPATNEANQTTQTTGAPGAEPASSTAPMTGTYRDDIEKCMDGKPIAAASLMGGPTCSALRRANQSGDASGLLGGVVSTFKQIRKERGLDTQ